MRFRTHQMILRMEALSHTDWERIDRRASKEGVGGERWEDAWLAAAVGHPAAIAAQSRALACGASTLAAAALAGAIAACEAEGRLTPEQQTTLMAVVGRIADPPAGGAILMDAVAAFFAA